MRTGPSSDSSAVSGTGAASAPAVIDLGHDQMLHAKQRRSVEGCGVPADTDHIGEVCIECGISRGPQMCIVSCMRSHAATHPGGRTKSFVAVITERHKGKTCKNVKASVGMSRTVIESVPSNRLPYACMRKQVT